MTPECPVEEGVAPWGPHPFGPAQVYPPAVELFRQDVLLREVIYIEAGVVKLVRAEPGGQEAILHLALSGAWLGTAAVIAGIPTPASAITCTESRVLRAPAETFRRLLKENAAFAECIQEVHARELCRQIGWMGQLSSLTSRQRLARTVRQLIAALGLQPTGSGIRLHLPLRHWELAQLVAVTPEHLSRLLRDMEAEGVIKRSKTWVIVPDVERLCPECERSDIG